MMPSLSPPPPHPPPAVPPSSPTPYDRDPKLDPDQIPIWIPIRIGISTWIRPRFNSDRDPNFIFINQKIKYLINILFFLLFFSFFLPHFSLSFLLSRYHPPLTSRPPPRSHPPLPSRPRPPVAGTTSAQTLLHRSRPIWTRTWDRSSCRKAARNLSSVCALWLVVYGLLSHTQHAW